MLRVPGVRELAGAGAGRKHSPMGFRSSHMLWGGGMRRSLGKLRGIGVEAGRPSTGMRHSSNT